MSEYAFFEATRIFKRAVPLMVKYKVPTTPHYFSLWYTYCAGTHPELNQAVDATVAKFGTCSRDRCDSLIESFLIGDSKKELDNFRLKVENLVADLGNSMDTTVSDTEEFQDILSSSVTKLEDVQIKASSGADNQQVIHELLQGSQHLLSATSQYRLQVTTQKAEIDTLKKKLEEYKTQATNDALTGCLNRRAFDQQMADFNVQNVEVSLIIVDIDHFKAFNDEYGHQMGDNVLKLVANKLENSMKDYASVYRFGGEEFAALVPSVSFNNAWSIAEKARATLERLSVTDKKSGQKINSITASFGVASRLAGEDMSELLSRADEALYDAKGRGRNCVMPRTR
ncbi:GGDEF domain-containing protein [Enterovibrio nigricans]|uniref:diguanylate cyclase n=1 Tax=Enterovibrio nigricans DSM 22720 TaxID=1121868 RepID=A0A1T4UAJ8_9GAMM|nr:GGDEF domain-containing protein [Enterovibrio nigricans]SKA49744.1 diguanylate cyclase [Enterovibrio nigricans DSM 22720]